MKKTGHPQSNDRNRDADVRKPATPKAQTPSHPHSHTNLTGCAAGAPTRRLPPHQTPHQELNQDTHHIQCVPKMPSAPEMPLPRPAARNRREGPASAASDGAMTPGLTNPMAVAAARRSTPRWGDGAAKQPAARQARSGQHDALVVVHSVRSRAGQQRPGKDAPIHTHPRWFERSAAAAGGMGPLPLSPATQPTAAGGIARVVRPRRRKPRWATSAVAVHQ